MTVGSVGSDGEALVRITVEGVDQTPREVEAVLDTGFNGFLALPRSLIEVLGLKQQAETLVALASGEERSVPTYQAPATLGEELRTIEIIEAAEPLVGSALLWGCELRIQYAAGGHVRIEKLSPPEANP